METTAVVFPGQGAQRPGMAADFFLSYPESREIFAIASDTLGFHISEICFTENPELNRTEFTQPAILTAEIAMFLAVKAHGGLQGNVFAGHSLGEYAALVAAGVMRVTDALQIVRKRGQLMQRAVPEGRGAMAALIHPAFETIPYSNVLSEQGVQVANYNSPSQVVISGTRSAVEKVCVKLRQKFSEMSIIALNVSAPFHCGLMKGIEQEFEQYLRSFSDRFDFSLAGKVVSNFSGTFHRPDTLIEALVRQISGCVKWTSAMELLRSSAAAVVEIGPTRVLGKFFSGIGVDVLSITDIRSMKRFVNRGGARRELCGA